MRRLVPSTLLSLMVVARMGSAQPAAAPPAPAPAADAKKEEAKAYFERGIALFEENAWDAALVEFARSRELYPTRAATKDAALCLRRLHRFDEALDLFEVLLRDFPGLPAEDRETAERESRDIAALVGRIELRAGEPGATVVVDSRARGTLPLPAVRVPAGTHVVRVLKEGFAPFETQVAVAGGQATALEVRLPPLMQGGRLKVTEQSGRAVDVLIDNVVVGKSPWEGTLPVGDHAVALDAEGDLGTQPARVPVKLNQLTPLTLSLEELGARLRIEPAPTVANVAVDGVVVGRGVWEGKVRAGGHRLEVVSTGYFPLLRDVSIASKKHEVVAVALERDPNAALTFRETEVARQEWLKRGGAAVSFELRAQGAFLLTRHLPNKAGSVAVGEIPSVGPYVSDATTSVDSFGGGGGGGVGLRFALMYLLLPDPSASNTWSAFTVGSGIDANLTYANLGIPYSESYASGPPERHETTTRYRSEKWGAAWMFNVPVTAGYQLGLGSFKGAEWRGVALGLAYAPSLTVLKMNGFDAQNFVNWAGLEASVDILDRPLKSATRSRYGRIFAYVLPPVGGTNPFIISVGGGAVWY